MKFNCKNCPQSGTVGHERCQHYHDVKAERAAINKAKLEKHDLYVKAHKYSACERQSHTTVSARY